MVRARFLAVLCLVAILTTSLSADVFVRGMDNALWHHDGAAWRSLGGEIHSEPDAASWGNGRIDVFARGPKGTLKQIAYAGGQWSQWYDLGGSLQSGPAAVSWGANRIDVVALGDDLAVWHRSWDGSQWTAWTSLGGEFQKGSAPDIASRGANRLDVFGRGTDDALWMKSFEGKGWGEWTRVGGTIAGSPGAVAWDANRIDVFVPGTDGQMWQITFDGTNWTSWTAHGGSFPSGSGADAASSGTNRLAVYGRGQDGAVWTKTWNGSEWSGWESLGGQTRTDPSAVAVRGRAVTAPMINAGVVTAPAVTTQPAINVGAVTSARTSQNVLETAVLQDPATLINASLMMNNWSFEEGLLEWTKTGTAFDRQPTLGDNVVAERVRYDMRLENNGVGGDYWHSIPYPIGHKGQYWIGTYEDRPSEDIPLGRTSKHGDGAKGTLTTKPFTITAPFAHFLIGGGNDLARLRVELQMLKAHHDALGGAAAIGTLGEDGEYRVILAATGHRAEPMRREVWEIPTAWRGKRFRIRIVDESDQPWGHINVDDFQFTNERPAVTPLRIGGSTLSGDADRRIWGFADTHTHPSNYLGFGGGMVQGRLYSADGNPASALTPAFEHVPHTRDLMNFAAFFHGNVRSGGGWPQFDSYPAFDNGMGQQMYTDWIRRAYDGGLRLMSALTVNNWLLSSNAFKKAFLGGSQPEDDRGSADVQLADLKRWAGLPQQASWLEIAYTPADARRIIAQNKLAIVLGVEADVLGNIVVTNSPWTTNTVRLPADEAGQRRIIAAELDRLYAAGVRQITPFHYVSGPFGGTAVFNRMFNEVSRKFTGENYYVEQTSDADGVRYQIDNDGWGVAAETGRTFATGDTGAAQWREQWGTVPMGHVNAMGLTQGGRILFEEMRRRGMLLDTDHASFKTTDELMRLSEAADFPVMSSHSDPLDLGFTGPGEFTHNATTNNDRENFALFGTTQMDNLRHEGMTPERKLRSLARVGGVAAPLMSTYRRKSFGSKVPNDAEGSSKTWAQMYLYTVDKMGGKGVALSTDRGFINFIAPRFGPNAAFMMSFEELEEARVAERGRQVEAQQNGVRYDTPIREWRSHRFRPADSRRSAYDYTRKSWEHEDAWKALAAFKAGRNPWTMGDGAEIPASGAPGHDGRIQNFARGFFAENEEQLESDCGIGRCGGATIAERYSAYAVKKGITPAQLEHWRDDGGVWEHYQWVKKVWDHWHRMDGRNAPLRRHVFGNRDFDVNIDGVAHYGMLPDFLQDLKNVGLSGPDLAPLFHSAEDYIAMWEKATRK